MKRKILIVLFGLGTIGGYASGAMHMRRCAREHRAEFESHVSHVCAQAALDVKDGR